MSIARKSGETFVVRIVVQAISLIVGILVARLLGVYGKGVYTYAATVLTLVVTLGSGQASAIAWQLAKGKQPPRDVYSAMLRTTTIFTIPIAAILIVLALVDPAQRVLYIVALALPFVLYLSLAGGFFLASSDVRSLNIQSLLSSVILLVALPPVLLLHGGVDGLLGVWVASYVAAAGYSAFRIRSYLADTPDGRHPYPFKDQFVFGLKTTLNTVVEYLNIRIDAFIILAMLGARSLGIYSLGIGVGELLWQLSRPVATAAFGRIGSSDEPEAAALAARCVRHSFAFVTAASVVAFFIGPTLITLVYGPQFAAAGTVLRLLLPGIIAYCIMPFLATFYSQQLGKPTIPLALSTISTVVCAGFTAAFIPRYGMAAGAVATSASYVTSVGIAIVLFCRRTGMNFAELFILNRDDMKQYVRLLASLGNRIAGLRVTTKPTP